MSKHTFLEISDFYAVVIYYDRSTALKKKKTCEIQNLSKNFNTGAKYSLPVVAAQKIEPKKGLEWQNRYRVVGS